MMLKALRVMVRNPFATLGWVLFLAVSGKQVSEFGTTWTFGRYFMHRSLVAPDGWHYANGAIIDPLTKALVDADREEEAHLILLSVSAAVAIYLAVSVARSEWRRYRLRQLYRSILANGPCRCGNCWPPTV